MIKLGSQRGFVDHMLAVVPGALAVYSVAMSIGKPQLALFMGVIVLMAGLAGYGLSLAFQDTKIHTADGWLFAIAALMAVGSVRNINRILPEEGFPFELFAGAMMFGVLAAGAIFAWRDGTLLFLSLPSIAIFGLVGTIDSYRPGLFLFCLFLVLVAVLYARTHQRTMIARAEKLGAEEQQLRRGAWRWMAGPEWAFAAASTIILFSFIGAPVVQQSLSTVSSQVRVNVQSQFRQAAQQNRANQNRPADTSIGTGPVRLSDTPIFKVKTDEQLYLKDAVYGAYTGRGWRKIPTGDVYTRLPISEEGIDLPFRRTSPIPQQEEIPLGRSVRLLYKSEGTMGRNLPIPGPAIEFNKELEDVRESGTAMLGVEIQNNPARNEFISGLEVVATIPLSTSPTTEASGSIDRVYTNRLGIPDSIRSLARNAVSRANATTDFERAEAIRRWIAANMKYNTEIESTPANRDATEYFLNESKEGYCDVFASAFILMARSEGIPARYATGYLMNDPKRDEQGYFTVREKDGHAWAEVYFAGYGWVPFDATEGAEDVTPDTQIQERPDWQRELQAWFEENGGMVAALAGGLALIGGLLIFAKNSVPKGVSSARLDVVRSSFRFTQIIERHIGHPKRFSQTLKEYVVLSGDRLGPCSEVAQDLAKRYDAYMFGAREATKDEIVDLTKSVDAFAQQLKSVPKPEGVKRRFWS